MSIDVRRGGSRVMVLVVLLVGLFVAAVGGASAQQGEANQVEFWCDSGVKFEPIDAPSYTVPQPPAGMTWTLLVIKSATDNQTFPDPVPGQSYSPSNGHDISHVILCTAQIQPPTSTTTTTTSTTTTTTTTTTTAAPTTTSAAPTTTTAAAGATTSTSPPPGTTPTTPVATTAAPGPTTPPEQLAATTTEPAPVGGVAAGGGPMGIVMDFAVLLLIGGALALLASLTLLAQRRASQR